MRDNVHEIKSKQSRTVVDPTTSTFWGSDLVLQAWFHLDNTLLANQKANNAYSNGENNVDLQMATIHAHIFLNFVSNSFVAPST
jgi:hypothetical protein